VAGIDRGLGGTAHCVDLLRVDTAVFVLEGGICPTKLVFGVLGGWSDRGMRHSRILQDSSNKRLIKMSQFAPMI